MFRKMRPPRRSWNNTSPRFSRWRAVSPPPGAHPEDRSHFGVTHALGVSRHNHLVISRQDRHSRFSRISLHLFTSDAIRKGKLCARCAACLLSYRSTPPTHAASSAAETELPLLKNILRKRDGFTLVELVVVIVVLLILMAIAVPSYLAVRDNARESGTKSNLTVGYKNVKAALAESIDGQSLPVGMADQAALVAALNVAEPGLTFVSLDTADIDLTVPAAPAFETAFALTVAPDTIYVHAEAAGAPNVVLLAESPTDKVFVIGENDDGTQIKSW